MKSDNFFVIAGKLCCVLLLFTLLLSCGKSESSTTITPPPPPPPPPADTTCVPCSLLYYGGDWSNGVLLDAGTYKTAARYTPEKIGTLAGKTIKQIRFYLMSKPDSIKVRLYGPKTDDTPGDLLYSAEVTATSKANTWNVHKLTQPITLKNEDIWLSIEFKLSDLRRTIGCDPGPALKDGDWLFSSITNVFTPISDGGTDINWNIRLNVGL